MSSYEFGCRLRDLRRAAGLSQRALAERTGLNYTYISKMECNRLEELPSAGAIARLAAVLDAPAADLLALAGKVPGDLRPLLEGNPLLVELVRVLSERVLLPETYRALIDIARSSL